MPNYLHPITPTGANELNKSNGENLRPEAPGDWAQKGEEDKHALPQGIDESVFSSMMESPLFKDLQEIEDVVKNSAINKPGVRGRTLK